MKVPNILNKVLGVFLLFPLLSSAQITQQDTSFVASSVYQAKKIYAVTIQGQARLHNGSDYLVYKPYEEEHPYFLSNEWQLSTVEYGGEYFENVPILYDISSDKLITDHYYTSVKMQLISELVGSFKIQDKFFVRITKGTARLSLATGFYEVLYAGKLKVYAKHTKSIRKSDVWGKLVVSFDDKNRYYIYKNGVYFESNSKASVLKILSDKKHELKQFARENKIDFKLHPEKALVDLTTYYDTITR